MFTRKLACSPRLIASRCSVCARYVSTATASLQQARQSGLPTDFQWFPNFFSTREQYALLDAALRKLDVTENRQFRRRRKELMKAHSSTPVADSGESVQSLFLPDEYYDFQEGHYDGVIRRYREMHVSSWPQDVEGLLPALDRLRDIYPSPDIQTHLLHLASDGEILPHVDNVGASGSWILGISLGAARVLKLEHPVNSDEVYTLALPSGSVYIQRDTTRYDFKHSILLNGQFEGKHYNGGQRMSIMIRDRFKDNGAQ
ncbi:uncharacterized protein C8Q71DRAFT_821769 [Rhodofomes roseus]|uniref:Alpha-ketoglutarate-dependent dioxygenase AlkB-like domain-containing protein n=1 Tax=Rhodofomes roseus TaxID=34475 RepID=A0ABQ8KKG2_9APHY|nr:uncharacterized protein C8Q71DRAFT_821769 [Rhodofomes roseus]KAH9838637.1 hypothetical protein C8Q71DRAFT_821769 [Rhodofomes roseus]